MYPALASAVAVYICTQLEAAYSSSTDGQTPLRGLPSTDGTTGDGVGVATGVAQHATEHDDEGGGKT